MSFDISIAQALDVWADLEEAYQGTNSYGGDTAEVYVYRLSYANPSVYVLPDSQHGRQAVAEVTRAATRALLRLLKLFKKRRDCRIIVDGRPLGSWLLGHQNGHRWHIRITPRKAGRP